MHDAVFLNLLVCLNFVIFATLMQDLAMELTRIPNLQPSSQNNFNVPLLARVYLKVGSWQWALSPGLDGDSSIQGVLSVRVCVCVKTTFYSMEQC